MRLASVILDIPTQALDTPYTYLVPEDAQAEAAELPVLVGCAVLVPFGHRQAVGFVVALEEAGAAASEGPGADSEEAPHEAHYGFGAQYEDAGPRPRRSHAGIDLGRLKPIVRALSKPYFDEEGAACAQWLSERYLAPLSSCVRLFTPPGGVPRMVRAREGYWRLEEPAVGEVDDRWVVPRARRSAPSSRRKNAVKQAVHTDGGLARGRAARGGA